MKAFAVFGARPVRGDIDGALRRLQDFARAHGGEAQMLDASAVFGIDHLRSAFEHAERARSRGTAVASSIAMEFLRYAAGERRIDRAIERIGAKPGSPVAIALIGDVSRSATAKACSLARDDRVLSAEGKSLLRLGITDGERRAIPRAMALDLVLERVALADLGR